VAQTAGTNSFGSRLRRHRERQGFSRAVLGQLVGRSAEWVKALESGRLQMPRLPMLQQLVQVLGLRTLDELTGDQSLGMDVLTKAAHEQAPVVADALLGMPPVPDEEPDLDGLARRIDEAWRRWIDVPEQKTAVAVVLPGLLGEARAAARELVGPDRRRAYVELARVYSLAQCFFAYQPTGELVWIAADRAMEAARTADDPLAIAGAAWYYGEVYREIGRPDRARSTALESAALLDPAADAEQRARWGHLQIGAALSEAQLGNAGHAWRHWDLADQAAAALGDSYAHPWLRFGRADVDGFALRMDVRLMQPGSALRRADRLDLAAQPGPSKRAWRLLDIAEAHDLRNNPVGVVHMIDRANRVSAETVRFSLFARSAVLDLSARRTAVRGEARTLAVAMGL
jgi:transcriptional regulator with XRE-family HTH domain